MKNTSLRRFVAWLVITTMTLTQAGQVAALTLASQPLAATTTSVVRPNLMYVLDDSGSMAWDYTPDYINDATTASDPNSQGGSIGDGVKATISGGHVTTIVASNPPFNIKYSSVPAVVITGGGGTGASATVNFAAGAFPKVISSITVTSGGNGYATVPFVALVGGLNTANWGMCWGTTGASNLGGTPKDTTVSPSCTTISQLPYSTAAINYQFYDPAVRYVTPFNANGSSYANSTPTAALVNGFSGSSTTNLTTSWQHEVWCNASTATPTLADPTAAGKCRENSDTSASNLFPNAAFNFRKTYNGPAAYFVANPFEYCADSDLTNCVASTAPTVVGGVTFNIASTYRWCSYYNPLTHSYGSCQGKRDLTHYVPNYLGGWVSTGAAGAQASASVTINAFTVGQSLTSITVGGSDIVGGATFVAGATDTPTTIATAVCTAINNNTASSGYGCARTNNTLIIQAAISGTAPNGLQLAVDGPPDAAALQSTGEIRVLLAPANYKIYRITIDRSFGGDGTTEELIGSSITALGTAGLTAQAICDAINSKTPSHYEAKSGDIDNDLTLNYGQCTDTINAAVSIRRKSADTVDNGAHIVVTGPPTDTIYSGEILINGVGGATKINDITLTKSAVTTSILGTKPLTYPSGTITDGPNNTAAIAADVAAKISGLGCTATANGSTVLISGNGPLSNTPGLCDGTLAVVANGTSATGKFRVSAGTSGKSGDLGGIDVNTTHMIGHLINTQLTDNGNVSANATVLKNAVGGGFSAAVPVASGGGNYDVTVTAPVGNSYNGSSFTFVNGTPGGGSGGTSPVWTFDFTRATADDMHMAAIQCGSTDTITQNTATTGSAGVTDFIANLSTGTNGLNGRAFGGYSYACTSAGACTLTGPPGAAACNLPTGAAPNLVPSSDATISFGSWVRTSAGSGGTPTWSFNVTGATTDNKNITAITCNGVDVINTSSTTPVNTVSTGIGASSATLVTDLSTVVSTNGLTTKNPGANGYSYVCTSGGACTLTGPAGAAACSAAQLQSGVTADSKITLNNFVQTSPGTTKPQWTFNLTGASADNVKISSIACGVTPVISANTVTTSTAGKSNAITNLKNSLVAAGANGYTYAAITGATAPAQRIEVTGPTGSNGAQPFCATTLTLSKDSTVSLATTGGSAIAGGGTLATSTAGVAATAGTAATYSVTITGADTDGRNIHSFGCGSTCIWSDGTGNNNPCNGGAVNASLTPSTGTTTGTESNTTTSTGTANAGGTTATRASGLATNIISKLSSTYWNTATSTCSGAASATTVSCTLVPAASSICLLQPSTNDSGLNVTVGGSSSGWTLAISSVAVGDSLDSITCPDTTARNNTVTRINNLKTGLNAINQSGYSFSCSTASNSTPSSACTVTGPIPTGAVPACNFDTSSTITPTDPTLTNTGGAASTGGTAPKWQFDITNATDDSKTVGPITCTGSGTGTLSTTASTGVSSGLRLNQLATGLNTLANQQNSYVTSCTPTNLAATGTPTTCTVTGPTGAAACVNLAITRENGTITDSSDSPGPSVPVGSGSPTWTFNIASVDISGATADGKTISSIQCPSGASNNTFSGSAPTTGTYDYVRLNNLATALASNDRTPYSITCTPASLTATSSPMQKTCTITGGSGTAAACTNMVLSKDATISATQPAQTSAGATSPVWTFNIANATAANKNINFIQCPSGTNTFDTSTLPNTGSASLQEYQRINHLTKFAGTGLQSIGANGYSYSCQTATATTIPSPPGGGTTCTVTGPVGVAACANLSITPEVGSGISTANMTRTAPGTDPTFSTENFAPLLSTVTAFSGGYAGQSTTPTGITHASTGTISTSTTNMTNGAPTSSQTIPNTATSSKNVSLSGGTDPDLSTNHWTGVGVFRRVDIVPAVTAYNRGSGRTDCVSLTCTYTEELQNFANWYTYYRTRMQMMKSATTQAFGQLNGNYRVGFDNICNATGTSVLRTVAQFVDSGGEVSNQRTNWWSSLTSANPSCATPLRTEVAKVGRYYGHKLGSVADPLQYSCQQNFTILVTDGYWNENEPSGTSLTGGDIGNVDNNSATAPRPFYDGQQTATACPATGSGRALNASSCRTLADVAWYYYSTDLRSSALSNATGAGGVDVATNDVQITSDDPNQAQHVNFFAMGLGIDGYLNYRSDYQTAGTGDFANIKAGTANWPAVSNLDPSGVDDLWHATVNGHGKYFSARNLPAVVAGLREALNKIGSRVGSAAAAATSNLEPVNGDNFAYVASYATSFWVGDLQSRSIDLTTGNVSSDTNCGVSGSGCQWSAQAKLDDLTWSARRLFLAPVSNASGDPLRTFDYNNLTLTEKAYFDPSSLSQYATLSVSNSSDITAQKLTEFLRGNRLLEQDGNNSHPQIWRQREHVLGDIVNTQPIFMKAPSSNYSDAGYSAFKTTSTAASRRPAVFVSAQDGMLHAFNADTAAVTVSGSTVQPGEEMWAYMPKQAMPNVKVLADPNYTHRYFVDGPITVADVNFGLSSNDWHTILVAGQGAGGSSYIALDVTDPLNPLYLWEFTDSRLGNTVANTTLTKLPNGEWAVVFTSGYNNADGAGYLFAVDPKTGLLKTGFPLSNNSGTGAFPSNLGKMAVVAIDPALNNTIKFVYAGDLNGDLWRFDFDPSATGHTGQSVFKVAHLASGSTAQPISTKPEVTLLPDGTQAIYVGTGKYLETPDLSNTDPQSFYAIKDTLGQPNLGAGTQTTWDPQTDTVIVGAATVPAFLQRKFISLDDAGHALTRTINGATETVRAICSGASSTVSASTGLCANEVSTAMDWGIYGGWFVNFPDTGERMNVDLKLVLGTLVFATNIPAASSCTVGGSAVGSQLDFQTGLGVVVALGVPASNIVGVRIANSLVVGVTVIRLGDGSYKSIDTLSDTSTKTLDVNVCTSSFCSQGGTGGGNTGGFSGKRGLWREFEAY